MTGTTLPIYDYHVAHDCPASHQYTPPLEVNPRMILRHGVYELMTLEMIRTGFRAGSKDWSKYGI
ncbi:MAG: hypothetical protein OXG67_12920, partial [bacterium]|nr:hypothetical protein [bacterium]